MLMMNLAVFLFVSHKRSFTNISSLHNFAHNHTDMIMCKNNDYILIYSILFLRKTNQMEYHNLCKEMQQKYTPV